MLTTLNSMPVKYPNLFSPLTIGNVTLKNRIVSTGHDTAMAAGRSRHATG